jgi:hypothetical protein
MKLANVSMLAVMVSLLALPSFAADTAKAPAAPAVKPATKAAAVAKHNPARKHVRACKKTAKCK